MLGIFLRAVIFGVGVELGREIYKTVKTRAKERLPLGEEETPPADDPAAPEPEASTQEEPAESEPEAEQPEETDADDDAEEPEDEEDKAGE